MSGSIYRKHSNIYMKFTRQPAPQPYPRSMRLFSAALYFICLLLLAGALTACGQETNPNSGVSAEKAQPENPEDSSGISQTTDTPNPGDSPASQEILPPENASLDSTLSENAPSENNNADDLKNKFGEDCITNQTFEVEFSQYEGKVYFVPFAPSQDNPDFHIQLIQDGKVLAEIPQYIPEYLAGETFSSLDAVSFYDINYDGTTDILLIETYGSTSFAAVYYGERSEYYEKNFFPQEQHKYLIYFHWVEEKALPLLLQNFHLAHEIFHHDSFAILQYLLFFANAVHFDNICFLLPLYHIVLIPFLIPVLLCIMYLLQY